MSTRDIPSTRRERGGLRKRRQRKRSVALIDSRSLIGDALAHRLRAIWRGCHVLLFSSATDLINDIATYENVDLILVSAHGEALDVVQQLCAASDNKRIVIISDSDEADGVAAVIREGARGYIPTSLELPVAVAAVEVVMAGGTFAPAGSLFPDPAPTPSELMTPAELGSIGLAYSHPSPQQCNGETPGNGEPAAVSEITVRELQVLASLAKGTSNKVIARELDMREGTVKVHIRSLLKKLNATNRTQLALRAYGALDLAQGIRRGHSTVPADTAADQGSTAAAARSQETEAPPVALIAPLPSGKLH